MEARGGSSMQAGTARAECSPQQQQHSSGQISIGPDVLAPWLSHHIDSVAPSTGLAASGDVGSSYHTASFSGDTTPQQTAPQHTAHSSYDAAWLAQLQGLQARMDIAPNSLLPTQVCTANMTPRPIAKSMDQWRHRSHVPDNFSPAMFKLGALESVVAQFTKPHLLP